MRIGLVQVADAPATPQDMVPWLAAALNPLPNAQLILLPELALCGYDCPQKINQMAISVDSKTMRHIAMLARERGQALVFGYAERAGERLYNAMCAISAQGEILANYRKTHLWSGYESALFTPGECLQIFTLQGMRFGMAICYDLDFPEISRLYAQHGMTCLLCISATTRDYALIPQQLVPARAYENGCFVAFANRGELQGNIPCVGMSRVVGPDGQPLAALPGAGTGTLSATVERAVLRQWRKRHPALAESRHRLYRLTDH
ncbi:carbon-nitrogen hydrolase [Erwinia endophytica]|uniref:nitrilase-related carbon-nitrogen hydrolase n=1 Tax=Erwinia endophytica TaxID=1563158 RepID=UPI001265EDCC|nr:nitrilase-related carbon-nitrogen hydrolase [Erwinia endophytica]KAB8309945.1 carbon-nitrogen hydrolase [Erwinia endophytica]